MQSESETALQAVGCVEDELHKWGRANQVTFDPSKESQHVPSRKDPFGPNCKLLGIEFYDRLCMAGAVHSLVGKARWKLKMLLRAKRLYTLKDLLEQYKQQILAFIEYRAGAIYHAIATVLRQLHDQQNHFVRELGTDFPRG